MGNESHITDKVSLFALATRKLIGKLDMIQLNHPSPKTAPAFILPASEIYGSYGIEKDSEAALSNTGFEHGLGFWAKEVRMAINL